MDNKSYFEKLKDPRWQKLRLKVLERDCWCCVLCNCPDKTLNVHHLSYENGKDPWEYELQDLATLCDDCHEQEKTDRQIENNLIKELKRKFISYRILSDITDAIRNMELPHVPEVTATILCDFLQDRGKMKSMVYDFFGKLNAEK